jgi:hypothetical protein
MPHFIKIQLFSPVTYKAYTATTLGIPIGILVMKRLHVRCHKMDGHCNSFAARSYR